MENLVKKLEEQITFLQQEMSQISNELYSQQKEIKVLKKEIADFKKSITRRNRMKKQFIEWKRTFGLEDEQYIKKQEDYRSKEVKSLLFDKYINKTLIEKNGIQSYFQQIM